MSKNFHVIANQSADWCGNLPDFAESTNGGLYKIDGIATSGFALLAMTCSFLLHKMRPDESRGAVDFGIYLWQSHKFSICNL